MERESISVLSLGQYILYTIVTKIELPAVLAVLIELPAIATELNINKTLYGALTRWGYTTELKYLDN